MSTVVNKETETGKEEEDGHQGKSGEEEVTPAECINSVDRGDSEEPVY